MKKFTTFLFILAIAISTAMAQAPQQFKYQAALRDADGTVMANEAVTVEIAILQGSTSGSSVFAESHDVTTTAQGIINLNIGSQADLSTVDWSTDTYFIQITVDGTVMGVSQLLSVPYAQFADEAGNTFSGSYTDLSETPTIPADVADLTDDSNIIPSDVEDLIDNSNLLFDGDYNSLTNQPDLFSGNYTDLIDKPVFADSVAEYGFSGSYDDLSNQPDLSDTANYKQELDLNGMDLTISDGNTVTLPGSDNLVPVITTLEIVALTPEQGLAVFNSDEDLYQVYDGTKWVSFNSDCWPKPTNADAGADQKITDGTLSATLAANTPEAGHGLGEWNIVSGTGGSFADATNPTTSFIGVSLETYILKWTILTPCATSEDEVLIEFYDDGAGNPVADNDGNTYQTVWIGTQNWMAENLKTTTFNDGTAIALEENDTDWANNTTSAYCWYNNDQANCADIYGALYNCYAVETGNLCPDGWHVPTDEEWKTLEMYLGMSQAEADNDGWRGTNEGSKLAGNAGLWYDSDLTSDSEFGSSGFAAHPGGLRYEDGTFHNKTTSGSWWSTTEFGPYNVWNRMVHAGEININRGYVDKVNGFSVRCLRD